MTLDHNAVDWHSVAGAHTQPVALHDVFQRRIIFGAVWQNAPRRLRREVEKCANCIAGAFACAQFQDLADKDQSHDHNRCFIVGANAVTHPVDFREHARQKCRD